MTLGILPKITFSFSLLLCSSFASAAGRFTQEQADRLTPGFARVCSSEISRGMSRIGQNGMPNAAGMTNLNDLVGFSPSQIQPSYDYVRRGLNTDSAHWAPIHHYMYCKYGYALAHWNETGAARPIPTAPRPNNAAKAAGLEPATKEHSPQFAAMRADILASCSVAIQRYAQSNGLGIKAANRILERVYLDDGDMRATASTDRIRIKIEKENRAAGLTAEKLSSSHAVECLKHRHMALVEGGATQAIRLTAATPGDRVIGGVKAPNKPVKPAQRPFATHQAAAGAQSGKPVELSEDEKYKAAWLRKNSAAAPTPAAPVAKRSDGPVEVSEQEGRPVSAGGASCADMALVGHSRPQGTAGSWDRYDYEMTNSCGVQVVFTVTFKDGRTHEVRVPHSEKPYKWHCSFGEYAYQGNEQCDGGIIGYNYR